MHGFAYNLGVHVHKWTSEKAGMYPMSLKYLLVGIHSIHPISEATMSYSVPCMLMWCC